MDPDTAAALRRWRARTNAPAGTPAPGRSRSAGKRTAPKPPAVREPVEPIDAVRPDGRRVVALVLPWQRPPVTLNARLGWAALHRARTSAAETVEWLLRDVAPLDGPVEVELVRYLGDESTADADNLSGTLKPCLDGSVRARVLPSDDHRTVVRTLQRVVPGSADQLGPGHPRLVLVLAQTSTSGFDHYGEAGETLR